MTAQNPEREQQRLVEVYAEMADGELEKLASEASTLSDAGRQALKNELSKRKLHVALQTATAAQKQDEHPALVVIAKFLDAKQAHLAKSLLDSAGIQCFLADENTVGMNFWPSMIEGIKLWVRQEDVESAEAILSRRHSGNTS